MIKRQLESMLNEVSRSFPAISIVGPRQSGKTTLCKEVFSEKPYLSFENPDLRERFEDDPRGFLDRYKAGAIFDEAQNCPELFSYLQEVIDDSSEMGRFILTGSQQFRLNANISQSLAGRVATFRLLPFSMIELNAYFDQKVGVPLALDEQMLKGFYPPLYDRSPRISMWYSNYVQTYIERDVRSLLNVNDLGSFQRFLRLCAARNGQLVNFSEIGSQVGVAHNTIKSWISILETSCIVFLLKPYHTNYSKRLVKTPKLYFYDTGLLCWLLSIRTPEQLNVHPMRGNIFESFVVSELLKQRFNIGEDNNLYFWRDRSGNEIDLLIEEGFEQIPVEIKSGMAFKSEYIKQIKKWSLISGSSLEPRVVYGGDESFSHKGSSIVSWRDIE